MASWALFIFALLVISGVVGHYFRPVKIRQEVVRSEKISAPVKVAVISDIHFGRFTGQAVLRKILSCIRGTNPDVIIHAGDSIDLGKKYLPLLEELLRELERMFPDVPKIAVPGNHHLEAPVEIRGLYEKYGVKFLRNGWASAAGIEIYGIRDLTHPETDGENLSLNPNPPHTWMPQEWPAKSTFRVLLSHVPGIVKPNPRKGVGEKVRDFDLIISGHTHGGLSPLVRWPHEVISRVHLGMASEMAPRRVVWGVTQIISRGLGAPAAFGLVRSGKVWIAKAVPLLWRHNCREIVEITLQPESKKG